MTDAAKGHYRKATGDPMTDENNRYPRSEAESVVLPPPGLTDCCLRCGRDEPLYLLEGADGDHTHICADCLRRGLGEERG